ncbi:MAG: hypothetical protein C0510_07695 [Erythrobacter sp.]|nr:hypothetical protein [Erythrobacter sp.]
MRQRLAAGVALAGALALSGCFRLIPPSEAPGPAVPAQPALIESAAMAGAVRGPSVAALNFTPGDAATALASFVDSCPQLTAREDASGLTRKEDWHGPCSAASTWPQGEAREFFVHHFETARVGDGAAFATGYFEPEIAGCRTRQPGCEVPVYAMPPDLVRDWPADVPEAGRQGRAPLGRFEAAGSFIPYYTRAEIEDGALAGRGLEVAWASDPVEFFFLQIQGSGRIRTADGEVIRIGYAGQNGREYVGLGRVMRDRGLIGDSPGQYAGSMQGIIQYLRDHPDEGRELMRLNLSWVFFRELNEDGPLGALGVPVRRESSAAVDPRFVPLGAPVWLDLDRDEADGLWIAQDTGGAIKGANRFDTFWGAGEDAGSIAGGMSGRGEALILLPKGTVERIGRR